MTWDRVKLIAIAGGIVFAVVSTLNVWIIWPEYQGLILGTVACVAALCLFAGLAAIAAILWFGRVLAGPRPLVGSRCHSCGQRYALIEVNREVPQPNIKFNFDHQFVVYECRFCGNTVTQTEHVW